MKRGFGGYKGRNKKHEEKLGGVIEVRAYKDEDPDSLVRRFKRLMKNSGMTDDIRKVNRYHKTKSQKDREKRLAALKRLKRNKLNLT